MNPFDITGRVVIITGGAGLLGVKHAQAIARAGGIPVLLDLHLAAAEARAKEVATEFGVEASGLAVDITNEAAVQKSLETVLSRHGRVDVLINNAANNPKQEANAAKVEWSRLENFPLKQWNDDFAVGVTGAFLCSQVFGTKMAEQGKGVILNVSSDLGLIGPDQRIYRKPGLPDNEQPVKPVTYSVVKSALIGLTKYLATYWAHRGVRVNSMTPGGVFQTQPADFVEKLTNLIPMGRMAHVDEYQGAVLFLCSDASSYMTGANLAIDGGRTAW